VLILVTGAATAVGAWQAPGMSPSMCLALRLGFVELLVGLAIGVVMLAVGQVLAAGSGPGAAFILAAALKPAHGVARGAGVASLLVVAAAVVLGLLLG
jgi:hypothetical protein